jgi:hypothetical protein
MRGERAWMLALLCLAVAVRVAAILVLSSHLTARSTYEHGEIAANLVAGRGFSIEFLGASGPTSQQAPVYPLLVALAYLIAGVETPGALLVLELSQALLGGVLVWGVITLAREIVPGNPWAARVSGLLTAVHPTLVYAATHVQVATLAATLVVWCLVAALAAARHGGVARAIGCGGLCGLLALTDPILALILPAVGWILLRPTPNQSPSEGHPRSRLRSVLIAGTVFSITLLPWIARNALVHRAFVPIKSTFGYAFWQGNCRLSRGTDKVVRDSVDSALAARRPGDLRSWNEALWAARHEAGYIDDIALSREEKAALGKLPEPDRSRVLFQRALAELIPNRYAQLCITRLQYFLLFDETNPKTRGLFYRIPHLTLSGLALAGLIFMPAPVRSCLAPSFLFAAEVTIFHTLTIVSARFHIPLEPLLALWAGVGLASIMPRYGRLASTRHHIERVGVERRGLHRGGVAGVRVET